MPNVVHLIGIISREIQSPQFGCTKFREAVTYTYSIFYPTMTSSLHSHRSPFGSNHLYDVNIWSCDGMPNSPSFAGGNFRSGSSIIDNANSSSATATTMLFPTTSALFGNPFSNVDAKREWSESSVQSGGKESLMSTDDDEWKDLEATLTSTLDLNNLQGDAALEAPITLDDSGRRDINGVALHEELKHFSGVVRLETFMEIFKVKSFSHMVEFFSVLQTQCNMVFDPRVGTMVIFRKHLYVPARKVVFKHLEPQIFARHYGMNSSPSISEGSRGSKRSSPRLVLAKSPSSQSGSKERLPFTSPSLKLPDKATVFDFLDMEGTATTKRIDVERYEDKAALRKRIRRRPQIRRKRRY